MLHRKDTFSIIIIIFYVVPIIVVSKIKISIHSNYLDHSLMESKDNNTHQEDTTTNTTMTSNNGMKYFLNSKEKEERGGGMLPQSLFLTGATTQPQVQRDLTLDFFRFFSLMAIFFRHTPFLSGKCRTLFLFVTFNVVLLIMGSALGARISNSKLPYKVYILEKIKAVAIPAYIFSTVAHISKVYFYSNSYPVVGTEDLLFLMGFFWFVRGYLLIYSCVPLVKYVSNSIKSHRRYYLVLIMITEVLRIFNQWMFDAFPNHRYGVWGFTDNFTNYCYFPIMFAWFFRIPDLTAREYWLLFSVSLSLLLFYLGCYIEFVPGSPLHPDSYKGNMRPPYIYYGYTMSLLIYSAATPMKQAFTFLHLDSVATFVSSHSLWMYLWHLCFLNIIPPSVPICLSFMVLVSTSFVMTKMQSEIIKIISIYVSPNVARNLRIIFG